MVNKVTLVGNLGSDPEVRRLDNGTMVARIPLATNESYKDKEGNWQTLTEWHNVVVWREMAERAEKQLKKGMQIYVEGKITYRKFQGTDGQDRYMTDIVASMFRLLGPREGSGTDNRFPSSENMPASKPSSMPSTNSEPAPVVEGTDDLPF